jgi:hypothetical protein
MRVARVENIRKEEGRAPQRRAGVVDVASEPIMIHNDARAHILVVLGTVKIEKIRF